MATRSVIGTAHDSGFEGRYCHWDGGPPSRGKQVLQTYRELGSLEAVLEYALRKDVPGYWSSYAPPSEMEAHGSYRTDNGDTWATDKDDWGAEWVYLLDERGITVLMGGTQWTHAGFVAWDEADPNWTAIECGDNFERCPHVAGFHAQAVA